MILINLSRKCLWARHIRRFICKIIQSLPTNDRGRGGEKWCERDAAPQHASGPRTAHRMGGPTCHSRAVIALWALLSPLFPIRRSSAAHTALALMKLFDEVAITDFCHCHRGQPWRRRRGWESGAGYLTPEGFSSPAGLRWMAGRLRRCQRRLESWIRMLLCERWLEGKRCSAACGDVSGLMDDPVKPSLCSRSVLSCAAREEKIFWEKNFFLLFSSYKFSTFQIEWLSNLLQDEL